MRGQVNTSYQELQEALRSCLNAARQAGYTVTYSGDSIILTPPSATRPHTGHSHYGYVCMVPDCSANRG